MALITLPNKITNIFFENLGTALDVYIGKYEKFLLAGDFNIEETSLSDFLLVYNLKNLVNDKTCFKSLNNPTTIDLFLTNSKKSFQNTCSISTGISDFHNMVITVLETTFAKTKPKMIRYRSYKHFDNYLFCRDLERTLDVQNTTYKHFDNYLFCRDLERTLDVQNTTYKHFDNYLFCRDLERTLDVQNTTYNTLIIIYSVGI